MKEEFSILKTALQLQNNVDDGLRERRRSPELRSFGLLKSISR